MFSTVLAVHPSCHISAINYLIIYTPDPQTQNLPITNPPESRSYSPLLNHIKPNHSRTLAPMTPTLPKRTPTTAQLRMSHLAGIRTMEENIIEVVVREIGSVQCGFEVGFREAFTIRGTC